MTLQTTYRKVNTYSSAMFFQPMKLEELEKITLEYPALTEVQKEIGKKMEEYYNANNYKSIYSVATILDPRFKLAYLKRR
jgi:hypothetical protein